MILFVILGIVLLIIIHEFGHFFVSKLLKIKVEEFGVGLPPKIFGKKVGDTIYSLNAIPFGGFVRIYGENSEDENDKDAFSNKPFWKKAFVILSGVFFNFIAAWIIFSLVNVVGIENRIAVLDVLKNSPAELAGIKRGDIIDRVEIGEKILEENFSAQSFIELLKNSSEKKVSLKLLRGGEKIDLTVEKRTSYSEKEGMLGIALGEIGIERKPIFAGIAHGLKDVSSLSLEIVKGLFGLIADIFKGNRVLDNLAGPVGVVSIAAKSQGLGGIYFLYFLGMISVNLAVLNLFPIPALDGGRLVIFLIEKLRGKKISFRTQSLFIGASFLLLIIFTLIVTFNDLKKIFSF